jgi:hypothetical protein
VTRARVWGAQAIGALVLAGSLAVSHDAAPQKPPCVLTTIALESDIDSGQAHADDTFRFVTVEAAQLSDGTAVPPNTPGYGVVAIAHHAERGGLGGYLVLETRFVALADGRHIPASIAWANAVRAMATGASLNVPGIVGAIPFSGYLLAPYGYLHHGKDVVIPRGRQIPVLLGDDIATGACSPPSPTPAPSATPAAAATATPSASTTPSPAATATPAAR